MKPPCHFRYSPSAAGAFLVALFFAACAAVAYFEATKKFGVARYFDWMVMAFAGGFSLLGWAALFCSTIIPRKIEFTDIDLKLPYGLLQRKTVSLPYVELIDAVETKLRDNRRAVALTTKKGVFNLVEAICPDTQSFEAMRDFLSAKARANRTGPFKDLDFERFYSTVQSAVPDEKTKPAKAPCANTHTACDPLSKAEEYRKILQHPVTLAVFRNGTCIFSNRPLTREQVLELMKQYGPVRVGCSAGDYAVAKVKEPVVGALVTYYHPLIVSFVSSNEFSLDTSALVIGTLARMARHSDANDLHLVHFECEGRSESPTS